MLLKPGEFKNAFVQATLPEEEITIFCPTLGDHNAAVDEFWLLKKSLYGLSRASCHWYEKTSKYLRAMGLKSRPLTIHVYLPASHLLRPFLPPRVTNLFKWAFMSTILSIIQKMMKLDLALKQFLSLNSRLILWVPLIGFLAHISSGPNIKTAPCHFICFRLPSLKTSWSAITLAISSTILGFSLVGSLNWLATNTRPDLAPVVSFLVSYSHCPSKEHFESALYAIWYLRSTTSHGIAYHSSAPSSTEAFTHYPFPHDAEAYHCATPPPHNQMHLLTGYCNANYGSQVVNLVPDGTELELFKFQLMSGFIIMRCGGPIAWKAVRQDKCSRSTCEAKICSIDETTREVLLLRHRCKYMNLPDTDIPTPLFNDNLGSVDWSKGTKTKGLGHLNIRDGAIRDSLQAGKIDLRHIAGKVNPSDVFTKEMRDTPHFCTLRDSFMMSKERFNTFVSSSSAWISASWVIGLMLG